jgi:hypothetical protein
MKSNIELLDVVALTVDLPDRGLLRGQVGTVVETLAPASLKSSSPMIRALPMHNSPSATTNCWSSTTSPSKPPELQNTPATVCIARASASWTPSSPC